MAIKRLFRCTLAAVLLAASPALRGTPAEPLDYLWTVSDPAGNTQTYTTPNIIFTAPNNPGAYTVTLTVTNTRTTCSNTTTETVTVTTPPAATSE